MHYLCNCSNSVTFHSLFEPKKSANEMPLGLWIGFRPLLHTVNSGSEMVEAKHVSGKNIFWSTLTAKSRGGKIFEFLHCPFEGRANMHHKIQPNWLTGRCCLAGGSKGQCRKSKIFLSLLLPMKVDQYIFFPETCFASTISEPEFTVWVCLLSHLHNVAQK